MQPEVQAGYFYLYIFAYPFKVTQFWVGYLVAVVNIPVFVVDIEHWLKFPHLKNVQVPLSCPPFYACGSVWL